MKNSLVKLLAVIGSIACASCTTAVIGGVVAAGGAGAATATDARGGSTVIDDQSLEHSVNNVLSAEIPDGSFTVASYNRGILLAGQVPTQADKDKSEDAVLNTAGVRRVFNVLSVAPNEDAGAVSKDAYLTSAAKSRLIAQKGVNANNIKVVTSSKIVYLLGSDAGKPHQIRAAITGIKSISGVRHVVSYIGQ